MSGTETKQMIELYNQEATPTLFLSGFFRSPAENFHTSEKIEYDIVRSDEDVSVAVQNVAAGYRENAHELFTNKEITPAVHQEGAAITVFDLMKREPGRTTYDSPEFQAAAIRKTFRIMRKMEQKIRRAQELQASQLMTTGKVSLTDKDGKVMYEADFKPKATHFFNAGTAWDQSGADILGDIEAACDLVREDGLAEPDMMIMGDESYSTMIKDDTILKMLDTKNLSIGGITGQRPAGMGGKFRGTLEVGSYKLDIFTYNGRYTDATGVKRRYIPGDKVVVMPSDIRLDATFGAIPRFDIPANASAALDLLPGEFRNPSAGMGMSVFAWFTPDHKTLTVEVGSRIAYIPTAIDQIACIDTGL